MTHLLPVPASAHAVQIDFVLTLVHILMLVLFAGWGAYFLYVLFRFRRGRQPKASFTGARGRIALFVEIGVVMAEAALLILIALPLWFKQTSAAPAKENLLVVRVVAEQFAWNVHYPGPDGVFGDTSPALVSPTNPLGLNRDSAAGKDDIVEQSLMHLPIDRAVMIELTSKDVIHSFGVPAMRVKQDAVPGLMTPVWFVPTRVGDFEIACSQLCGLGHYRMRGIITVESAEAFQKWLEDESRIQKN
jgi:cytochrome c oxidase subunit 2